MDGRPYLAHLLLGAAWLASALLVGFHGDFPLNDDWQYAYPVQQLVEQGQLDIKAYFSPNILLQVYWGALFCELAGGFSFEYLRLSTWVAAGFGGWGAYALIRRLGSPHRIALLGTAAVLFSPIYYHLSFSFMTDVPFLAVVLWACWAGLRFLEQRQAAWLALFVLLSITAYLNRQPGILLLPAMGGCYWLRRRGHWRDWAWALASLAAAAAVYLLFERLAKPWLGIDDNYLPVSGQLLEELLAAPAYNFGQVARRGLKTWVYIGFFSLPLLPFLWQRLRHSGVFRPLSLTGILLANAVLLYAQHLVAKIFPYGGNILFNWGLGPELLGDVYTFNLGNTPQLPGWSMYVLGFISQLSATVLSWLAVRTWQQLQPLQRSFFTFLLLLNIGNFLVMSVTAFFDRYVLLSIISALLFFTHLIEKPGPLPRYVPLALFALFSLLATRDYLAWNRARAAAFAWTQDQGISIREIDAGYEYNGWYNYQREQKKSEEHSWWWVTADDWMIAFGPRPGYETAASFPYRRWLWGGREATIQVLREKP